MKRISEIGLPRPALEFLGSQGFDELYPPQAASVRAGLLQGRSVLVSAPTASGKTLIATMAILAHLSGKEGAGKVVYLSPLRALAAEKYAEFKRMEKVVLGGGSGSGRAGKGAGGKEAGRMRRGKRIKVAVSTGDFDGLEKNLKAGDVLVLTNEKMDAIMRHNTEWVDDIGLVIADEIHLIGDQDRGPTLEMVLSRLKRLEPRPQIVGLSATVTNSGEIARWLGCRLVKSEWRPVPLSEGVCGAGEVVMRDGRTFEVAKSVRGLPVDLGVQCVVDGGQSLVFAETRTRSASLATKAADAVSRLLGKGERAALARASSRILAKNENTELVKRLATLVGQGVAFHHAGLSQGCRDVVESEFRRGRIRLVSSTPTLAAGVNLPARRVVISSINRYDAKAGINKRISVMEYKQLCGRAGRPQYDDRGESVVVAGNYDPEELADYYIGGEPEPVESKITDDRSLRIHVLSVVVTNPGLKKEEVLDFFLETLGGHQSTKSSIRFAVNIALRFLLSEGLLLKKGERYAATEFGQKTSKMYIDPMTAMIFRKAIDGVPRDGEGAYTLGFLHLVSTCDEFFPRFGLRNKDYEAVGQLIEDRSQELLEPVSEYDCNRSLLALDAWVSESPELSISDRWGVESGDMHRMVETGGWLLHCMREIAKGSERADLLGGLDVLRRRVAYGIRGELADLVRVKGVGRVRARALYKHGIRNAGDLAGMPVGKLARIDKIGPTVANNIKTEARRVRR